MNCVSDTPCHNMLRDDLWVEDEESRKTALQQVTLEIVQSFVDLEPRLSHKKKPKKSSKSPEDKVYLYSCEFLTLGLMYIEFSDSIREADGNRILRCWRYQHLIFRSTQRRNYAIEGLNLLSQYHFLFHQGKGNSYYGVDVLILMAYRAEIFLETSTWTFE